MGSHRQQIAKLLCGGKEWALNSRMIGKVFGKTPNCAPPPPTSQPLRAAADQQAGRRGWVEGINSAITFLTRLNEHPTGSAVLAGGGHGLIA